MTKVKGIELKQVIGGMIANILFFIIAIYGFGFCEEYKYSLSENEETMYYAMSVIFVFLGVINTFNLFKMSRNSIEILSEKIILKNYEIKKLSTQYAEISYSEIREVTQEKRGIWKTLIIHTKSEKYELKIKDVDRLIPIIKGKASI